MADITVHNFEGTPPREVYDRTQTDDSIKDGDVLNLGNGNVAILMKAWPTVVLGEIEGFHRLASGVSFESIDDGKYAASAAKAREASNHTGPNQVYETGSDDTFWNSKVVRVGERFNVQVFDADGDRRPDREDSFADQALAIAFADKSVQRYSGREVTIGHQNTSALISGEYKIRVPLKALLDDTQVKTLVAALQLSYDDGTAGGFDITSTGPVSVVTFYREMGDDLDVIQDNIARNALKSREPEAVVVEQLANELAEHQDESPGVQEIVATIRERGASLLFEGDLAMVREELGTVLQAGSQREVVQNEKSVSAATAALQAHASALGIEGGASIQLWHLLASLSEWAAVNGVSVEAELRDFNRTLITEGLNLPAAEAALKESLQSPSSATSSSNGLPSEFCDLISSALKPGSDQYPRSRS